MANLTKRLRSTAQQTANQTGRVRWINYTSLGWRIEKTPAGPENLRVRFDPATNAPRRMAVSEVTSQRSNRRENQSRTTEKS